MFAATERVSSPVKHSSEATHSLMEQQHRRHILPSNLYSGHIQQCQYCMSSSHAAEDCDVSLAEPNGIPRAREPLSDAAGNSQLQSLYSAQYNDFKLLPPMIERPMYPTPTVPSQPASLPSGLLRRASQRKRRQANFSRNPIIDSPQYQAYRDKQQRDNSPDEQVWPDVLEFAFLDALLLLPHMHRRKFSYSGKPYGRNELISQYLWISYVENLPPGAKPDPSMRRDRKKVSSHIQVLKAFLRGHPAFHRLFPPAKKPDNGFEDSYKNDPTLIAISHGRLPRKQQQYDEFSQKFHQMRPETFFVAVISSIPSFNVQDTCELTHKRDLYEDFHYKKGLVAHRFTGLANKQSITLELEKHLPEWRIRFPHLNQIYEDGELHCNIIHMEVGLELQGQCGSNCELLGRLELSIEGEDHANEDWRCYTILDTPPQMNIDPKHMPPQGGDMCPIQVHGNQTWTKLPFHAPFWAQAFTCLRSIQESSEGQVRDSHHPGPHIGSAADYLDRISMFYDVQAHSGQGKPWNRRALILWTFHEVVDSAEALTTWRYLEPPPPLKFEQLPPRSTLMEPSPQSSHYADAAMHENMHAMTVETGIQHLHEMFHSSSYNGGLQTPPLTGGLASPFSSQNFAYTPHPYGSSAENMSFVSNSTFDEDTTLVHHDHSAVTASLEGILSGARDLDNAMNMGIQLHTNNAGYDHNHANWDLHTASENFEPESAWGSFAAPSHTSALAWDSQDTQKTAWSEMSIIEGQSQGATDANVWAEERTDWTEVTQNDVAVKELEHTQHVGDGTLSALGGYVEGSVEQRLVPWIDDHSQAHVQEHHDHGHEIEIEGHSHAPAHLDAETELKAEGQHAFESHGNKDENGQSHQQQVERHAHEQRHDDDEDEDGYKLVDVTQQNVHTNNYSHEDENGLTDTHSNTHQHQHQTEAKLEAWDGNTVYEYPQHLPE